MSQMDDFDDDDDDDDGNGRSYEETMAILKEIEIDRDMLINLTREDIEDYDCPFYELEKLEGNYIEEFERKVQEGSIEVSETYQNYIKKTGAPLRAFDPRTGIYGIKYTAAGFYSAGCMYMEQEKWDEAIANFAKAIELQPRHVPARGNKAKCYFSKGDFLRAHAEAWNAIDLNPVIIAERDEKSRELFKLVHPDSTAQYERILVEHLLLRGMAFLYAKDYNEALEDFDEVLKRNPDVVNARYGRVAVYMKFSEYWKFDEWDKIVRDCDMLIKAHYEELYALQCRGISYGHLEKRDEAIADFTAALSMEPNLTYIYTHRSHCYYKKKEYEKALADANEAIRRGSTDAFFYRGIVYIELKEYGKAIADFDEAIRLDAEDESSVYQREKAVKLMNGESFEEEE